ncbi:MAG: response regulator [Lachnospiraceae bacterium]|nr:response regulator [Lachnospiraceae bacterium]
MKYFKKIIWIVLFLDIAILVYAAIGFKVDDMTLSKGVIYDFNAGWEITWENGDSTVVSELPFLGESLAQEKVVMENTLPREYWGMTMSFLSADKMFRVFIDDVEVYQFGEEDTRCFGRTPGSVVNFIDIPSDLDSGKIRIEMSSPYDNYAAKINEITIGQRDVLILKLMRDNAFNIACSLIVIVCGVDFALLSFIQKASKQSTGGMPYICGYCIVTALYYFVETKTLSIFYGNQSFYSVLVFLCLMVIPFWLILYYGNEELGIYQKRWKVLLGLICANIVFQMFFQILNIFDFMEMAFVSHALLGVAMIVTGVSYIQICRAKHTKDIYMEIAAWFVMAAGGMIDILRMYMVGVGDMGKFSRLGTTAFSLIMLYKQFGQIVAGYSYNIEENARLLQREMEYMEKKNEQLEKANALAEEAKKEALAADAAKGKFLAHMSHEIRTPINAVLGMNTMILRETKDMQIKEYALDIQNAGQNLLALINDILDFSKIESGKLEIILVEYDFSSMIHDISNMIIAKMGNKKLDFHICVDENVPSKLLGDDVRIRQVLVNLLNNAVKYTKEGSVTLSVGYSRRGDMAVLDFSVKDTGIGIKKEDISRLFEEFERIEEKRNRNIEGTGLGINITMQLLELMGSTLNVESEYGKGSHFYFSIEQKIVDEKPVGNLEERLRQQSVEYSYMEVFTAPEAQLLVVDDNAMNLKVFISLLKTTKVNVDVADGGRACLEMVCRKHYDLIFLDHMMPDMDGIETLHELKKLENSQCQNTPVIALTANAITGAKEMYLAEGFDAFLSKPINPEKLEQMILLMLPRELLKFDVEEETGHEEEQMRISSSQKEEESLPMIEGVDWSYGLLHLPDKELLLDTVSDFYKSLLSEAERLEDFYQEIKTEQQVSEREALEQYRIKVHSMKSSANMIGALVLGGMAKLLEDAAKNADIERIDSLTPIFLKEWCSYREKLEVCVKRPEEKVEEEDDTVILAYFEMLRVAMEELDIDRMDESMEILEKFVYPADIQIKIEELSTLVTNMDSEQALPLIEELMRKIQENKDWREDE